MTKWRTNNTKQIRRRFTRLAGLTAAFAALLTGVVAIAGPVPSASALASPNIARYGYATQSSTSYGGTADRANDGNTDGNYTRASTTATARELNPWWQVDLGRPVDITSVKVWNRTDCCADRLSDYWIFLSPTPFTSNDPNVLATARGVTAIHMTSMPQPADTVGTTALARFVRIQLSGTNYLSLSEVQVFGNPEYTDYTNFAAQQWPVLFNNRITQSSVAYGGDPRRAVDLVTDGRFVNGSVATTDIEANPWWQDELPESRYLYDVRVWNRTDCCAERLSNFWVFVSENPFTSNDPRVTATQPGVKAVHVTSVPSPSVVVPIGANGKFVRIQIEGTQYLSLAEVEINGRAVYQPLQAGVATQSSTGWGGAAQRAQDGSNDGSWYHNSVTATTQQNNPWWQVDLGELGFQEWFDINSINVWNRTDCCIERLSDYWIFVSTSPFTSDDPNVTAAQPGVTAYHITSTPTPETPFKRLNLPPTRGRYVRIQIPGNGVLSLAEVQIYGNTVQGIRL